MDPERVLNITGASDLVFRLKSWVEFEEFEDPSEEEKAEYGVPITTILETWKDLHVRSPNASSDTQCAIYLCADYLNRLVGAEDWCVYGALYGEKCPSRIDMLKFVKRLFPPSSTSPAVPASE